MVWIPPPLKTERLELVAPSHPRHPIFNDKSQPSSETDCPGLPSNWRIIMKTSKQVIGSIGYIRWVRRRPLAELGFILKHNYRNGGYMTEAAKAVIAFGFERMHLDTVEARSFPHNRASIRVFEKLGMQEEEILRTRLTKKGEWVDLVVYRIQKQPSLGIVPDRDG